MTLRHNTADIPGAEPARRRSWFRSLLPDRKLLAIAALAFGGDQLVKAAVTANLSRGESWPAEGFVRVTHAWNTGAAFSLLRDQNGLMTVVSLVVVGVLVLYLRSSENESKTVRVGLALALGGAFGNIADRLRLGHVTDIFDVGPWPIFNTADSAIVVGLGLVFWTLWSAEGPVDSHPATGKQPPNSNSD